LVESESNIKFIPRFINEREMHYYLSVIDVIALPFKKITNSGSALLALSFNKPIIAPLLGAIIDLKRDFGCNNIITYMRDFTSNKLNHCLDKIASITKPIRLKKYNWGIIGQKTDNFYFEICK
jgi:beta-1,4-mannosyltransferase